MFGCNKLERNVGSDLSWSITAPSKSPTSCRDFEVIADQYYPLPTQTEYIFISISSKFRVNESLQKQDLGSTGKKILFFFSFDTRIECFLHASKSVYKNEGYRVWAR